MTRLYIELAGDSNPKGGKISKAIANQEFVMKRAKEIMRPYKITWSKVEWFGIYQIGQRVSSSFSDQNRVFISGDAGHTHSPKACSWSKRMRSHAILRRSSSYVSSKLLGAIPWRTWASFHARL